MSQDKQFHQYGYDHYLKAPKKRRSLSSGDGFFERPLFKYSALALVVALFGTVIYLSYPSDRNDNIQIPIVQADLRPVKAIPDDPQGMDIPFQDNTLYATLGENAPESGDEPVVRNLFDEGQDEIAKELITKEDALEEATASAGPYESAGTYENVEESPLIKNADEVEGSEIITNESDTKEALLQKIEQEAEEEAQEITGTEPSAEILQKVKPKEVIEFEGRVASAAIVTKPRLHAAATSPETMELVRSVLNNEAKENKTPPPPAAAAVASIDPAAGAAKVDPVGSKQYFVQLASITERTRASAEYRKLQDHFLVLAALPYRVQEASLPSGKFYRIQTGPFSKEQAEKICNRIKEQKPGGCLVVR